jgi:integral membrane sensor domain MASE1
VQLAPGFAAIVLVTGLATALSLVFARHPAPMGSAWLQAALLFGAACGLMLLARRRGIAAVLLATIAAAVPALVAHHGAIESATGVQCIMHELVNAAVPLVALALWRRTEGLSRAGVVGLAAAGALAGDAALHVSCSAADSVLHLLVFHVGGVALAAALAASIAGRLLRLGTATA